MTEYTAADHAALMRAGRELQDRAAALEIREAQLAKLATKCATERQWLAGLKRTGREKR